MKEVSCKNIAVAVAGMVRVVENLRLLRNMVVFHQMICFFYQGKPLFTPVLTMTVPAVLSDILINFLKEVAAAAPALPFYYYHIPALTGVKSKYCFF